MLYRKYSGKLDLTKVMLVCGGMVSPAMVGSISEMAGGNLKMGLLKRRRSNLLYKAILNL